VSVRKHLSSTIGIAWLIATPAFAADPSVPPLPAYVRGSGGYVVTEPGYPVTETIDRWYPPSPPATSPIVKALVHPRVRSWTGFYLGAHVGGGVGAATFADPFGSSIFGDTVRTPAFVGGGQIGYNWQVPNSRWVLGVQADVSGLASEGTNTCFAYSASAINTTCRVRPEVTSTLTGRFGYAFGPDGRTLIYAKGGLAWADSRVDEALNNDLSSLGIGPAITSNSSNLSLWGGTVGGGAEYVLTPAWSLFAEYDYLSFGNASVANLGSSTWTAGALALPPTLPVQVTAAPPGSSGMVQNIQEFKVGLNYKLGADPLAPGLDRPPPGDQYPDPSYTWFVVPGWGPGWELETDFRYMYSSGLFHKDIGQPVASGLPGVSSISRLTYNDTNTSSGEFFARLDMPSNFFVKGFVGGGATGGGWSGNGHMNDEDFGIPLLGTYAPYSNTLSANATAHTFYGVFDAGYDFMHASSYKVGGFVGYFHFDEGIDAFGCAPIANINCIPNTPLSGSPGITETDHWDALRIGAASEVMLTSQVKLSGDVAYLPYVTFNGVDNHFFGNSAVLAEINPETGHGQGVQLEGILSYYFTPTISVGVGGRYWGLWTTSGTTNRTFDANGSAVPSPAQFFSGTVEQAEAFIQMSLKFGVPGYVAARDTE
jgi:opacity protein-like surface antigen